MVLTWKLLKTGLGLFARRCAAKVAARTDYAFVASTLLAEMMFGRSNLQADAILYREIQCIKYDYLNVFPVFSAQFKIGIR